MKKSNCLLLYALLYNVSITANQNIPNIFQEARAGNKEAIKKRLENCENCAVKDEQGNNVLHIAVQEGQADIIDILTTAPDYSDLMNWLYAFLYAPTLPNIDEPNNNGETPLHCTIRYNNPDIAERLVKKGASMEALNKENCSAVFAAVKHDAPHFIPIFVAHKLDLNKHRRNGETIFHYAIKENKPRSIHYCAQKTSLSNTSNSDNKTPTFLAIDTENIALLDLLRDNLNSPANNGIKPIHYATRNGKQRVIEYLLNNHISINEPDEDGNPPLFYAIDDNNEKIMNYLLGLNADLNKRNNKGEDALAIATRKKHLGLINVLAKKHAVDIDARDNKGQTSFMRSAIEKNYESMNTLINLGVNIRITDTLNENALHKIARTGDSKGAKIILTYDNELLIDRNKDGLTPLAVAAQHKNNTDLLALLIAYKADVNTEDNNGLTPLHHAAAHDNVDAMIILQNHGTLSTQRTNKNNTIAHSAAEKGAVNALDYCIRVNAQLLYARNAQNETPFIVAAKNGQSQAVKLLLHDADFISRDITHAMEHARKNGHRSTLTFLQNKVAERTHECKEIADIRATTMSLVNENKNSLAILCQKNPAFLIHYMMHTPTSLDYLSADQLYSMTDLERNRIKSLYLENQNRELNAKTDFAHSLATIIKEETRIAAEKQAAERADTERIRQQQQAELNRIAENNRIQHNNAERARMQTQAAERVEHQNHIVNIQDQDIVISIPINQNYLPQEEDEDGNAENQAQKECCICFEDLPTIAIPCQNKHTDFICGGCLARLKNCPICRAELRKQ